MSLGNIDLLAKVREEIRIYENSMMRAKQQQHQPLYRPTGGFFFDGPPMLPSGPAYTTVPSQHPNLSATRHSDLSCKQCGKFFTHAHLLAAHMKCHTAAEVSKPYPCEQCSQSFLTSQQLRIHLRSHAPASSSTKPLHNCSICSKSFGSTHALKLHQIQHFSCKVYKCIICGDTYDSKKAMEMHFMEHDTVGLDLAASVRRNNLSRPQHQVAEERPNSTGSTLSNSDDSYIGGDAAVPASPVDLSSSYAKQQHQLRKQATSAASRLLAPLPSNKLAPVMLPSINTICSDDDADNQPLSLVTNKRRGGVNLPAAPRNIPLFPITSGLISALMAEDVAQFGRQPIVQRVPDFSAEAIVATAATDNNNADVSSYDDLPKLIVIDRLRPEVGDDMLEELDAAHEPPQARSPSLGEMENCDLPLRKLYQANMSTSDDLDSRSESAESGLSSSRGSVIKFAQ